MAESDTTRFGLRRWTADSDTPSRSEFDTAHANIESYAAGFTKGTLASRPTASAAFDRWYYLATDDGASPGTLYFCNASVWTKVYTPGRVTIPFCWTYTLPGDIHVPSGQTDFLPYAFIDDESVGTLTLRGYRWYLSSGTSFTFSLKHKTGSTLATNTDLVTGVVAASASVKGSAAFGTPKVAVAGDVWLPVITAISGAPNGGAVSVYGDIVV